MKPEYYQLKCGCVIKLISNKGIYCYTDIAMFNCRGHMFRQDKIKTAKHPTQWNNKGKLITKTDVAILKMLGGLKK